jgi:hypothetical protein
MSSQANHTAVNMGYPETVSFTMKNVYGPGLDSRFVNVANPSKDLRCMEDIDGIVAPHVINIAVDFPLRERVVFRVVSRNATGYKRGELVNDVCKGMAKIFNEEAVSLRDLQQGGTLDDHPWKYSKYGIDPNISLDDLQLTRLVNTHDNVYLVKFEI